MFLDEVDVDLAGGHGGRGAVSFRREKYVPSGGPDGGDGGRGGDVVLVADRGTATLSSFRDRRRFRAEDGRDGAGARRTGRGGATLEIGVPVGTVVTELASGRVLADLVADGERVVAATGGRGGRGNARFATAARRAPRIGELGEPGESRRVRLELRLIADVGLVGLPNAGKSTLLGALTGARPAVGAHPFTTLHPNLGVAELDAGGRTAVIADVPGLIEGAHAGAGLGTAFLRHLDRTRLLVQLADASEGPDAVRSALGTVDAELAAFGAGLAARPRVVALTKLDLDGAARTAEELVAELPGALAVSAAAGLGLDRLLGEIAARLAEIGAGEAPRPPVPGAGGHRVYRHRPGRLFDATVVRERGGYRVRGAAVERAVAGTDLASEEAVLRLQRRLRAAGIDAALAGAGCQEGDTVMIGDAEFSYRR